MVTKTISFRGWFLARASIAALSTAAAVGAVAASSSSCSPFGARGGNNNPAAAAAVVGHQTLSFKDAARDDRPVTVDVWYPAKLPGDGTARTTLARYNPLLPSDGVFFQAIDGPDVLAPPRGGGYPLLVFSHGNNAMRSQSATLMEHLASWGFVVAAPDHAGNSYNDDPSLGISFVPRDRPLDMSFVIDQFLSEPHASNFGIDVDLVGAAGNSYGGLTTAHLAGGYNTGSVAAVPPDPRVKAVMPISPAVGTDRVLAEIRVPMLVIGGQNDTVTPPDQTNAAFFDTAALSVPRWNLVVGNAGHTSFQDTCVFFAILLGSFAGGDVDLAYALMGAGDPDLGKTRVGEAFCDHTLEDTLPLLNFVAAAFFRAVLSDDATARDCLDGMADHGAPLVLYQSVGEATDDQTTASEAAVAVVATTESPAVPTPTQTTTPPISAAEEEEEEESIPPPAETSSGAASSSSSLFGWILVVVVVVVAAIGATSSSALQLFP